jgi:DNA-binding beta-propeller fold protein YncE
VASATASPGLLVINGQDDQLARAAEISAGGSPGLMVLSPDRSFVLAFDSSSNSVEVISSRTQALAGDIQLAGPTTSMVALAIGSGLAAVPSAPMTASGTPPGAVQVMNLQSGGISSTISVPSAQTVVASPNGNQVLAFSNNSDVVTVISPLLVNTGSPVTATVPGFDQPVYAVFSADGSTAYVLNCGPECSSPSATASIQTLDMATLAVGTPIPVDGATIGWLSGSTLYVAGTPTASASNPTSNNSCTGQDTTAATCGRLDIIDLGSMTVTGSAIITDGYHNRIDMSVNGQLFIGSHTCTNIGDVSNPQGEVRGCLSVYNTTSGTIVIPPDNGDVTGFQGLTSRYVEYVAEGGNLRVYDTLIDGLLLDNVNNPSLPETGTVIINGYVVDVKAIDFF